MEKQTNDYQLRYLICLVLLRALFLLLVFLNINHGSVQLSLRETMAILLGHCMDDTGNAIIWEIRLPRMLASIILGGALALAGVLFWVALVRARRRAARGEEHVPDGSPRSETE